MEIDLKYEIIERISQKLYSGDADSRLAFCEWLLNFSENHWNGSRCILWSDESNFSNSGIFNKQDIIIDRKKTCY